MTSYRVHNLKKFDNTGEDMEDLISIGTIGLIKAIESYRPNKGTKLATFAARCFENEEQLPLSDSDVECDINIGETLLVLSGKWKLSLLYELVGQTLRFNDLQRALPGISEKMLGCQPS